jgi:hypothetical protein
LLQGGCTVHSQWWRSGRTAEDTSLNGMQGPRHGSSFLRLGVFSRIPPRPAADQKAANVGRM